MEADPGGGEIRVSKEAVRTYKGHVQSAAVLQHMVHTDCCTCTLYGTRIKAEHERWGAPAEGSAFWAPANFVDAFETLLCIDGLVRSKEVYLSFGGPLEDSLLRHFEKGGAGGGC